VWENLGGAAKKGRQDGEKMGGQLKNAQSVINIRGGVEAII